MTDLIEALTIFRKYLDHPSPTRVEELGFFWDDSEDCWKSFRFGSA